MENSIEVTTNMGCVRVNVCPSLASPLLVGWCVRFIHLL